MTTTLAVDTKNDIYIASTGSLALVSALNAVLQACQQAAQAQRGEMIYQIDKGVPTLDTVWTGSPKVAQFKAYLRRTLMGVVDVLEVTNITTRVADNELHYTATIRTIHGTGNING